MKLKSRPTDFKVRELLREGVVLDKGEHRVYRVTKRKRTSLEAAGQLADLAGVPAGEVSMAGLKDRQGVTQQFMSIPRGKPVSFRRPELLIEPVGFAARELSSGDSLGNEFRIVLRALGERELERLRESLPMVRENGVPNYFDEQRFGNLRHNQGWIALDLVRGRYETALRRLLTAVSDWDGPAERRFKSAIYRHWGDWSACRDIAGRFGKHHSVFEHLRRHPGGFAGAFRHVASRLRLIHLYAFQSHLWNRAVARCLQNATERRERYELEISEGNLILPLVPVAPPEEWGGSFPLPGARLEGVRHESQRRHLAAALALHRLTPDDFFIEGVPGFVLKPVERALFVVPGELRLRPAEPDPLNPGDKMVRTSFTLPRGAYASLVVKRLVGPRRRADARREPRNARAYDADRRDDRYGGYAGYVGGGKPKTQGWRGGSAAPRPRPDADERDEGPGRERARRERPYAPARDEDRAQRPDPGAERRRRGIRGDAEVDDELAALGYDEELEPSGGDDSIEGPTAAPSSADASAASAERGRPDAPASGLPRDPASAPRTDASELESAERAAAEAARPFEPAAEVGRDEPADFSRGAGERVREGTPSSAAPEDWRDSAAAEDADERADPERGEQARGAERRADAGPFAGAEHDSGEEPEASARSSESEAPGSPDDLDAFDELEDLDDDTGRGWRAGHGGDARAPGGAGAGDRGGRRAAHAGPGAREDRWSRDPRRDPRDRGQGGAHQRQSSWDARGARDDRGVRGQWDDRGPRRQWDPRGRDHSDDRGNGGERDDRGERRQWDPRGRGPGGQRDDRGPRRQWEDRGRDPRDDRGARDPRDDRGQSKQWDPRDRGHGGQRDDRGPRMQWEDRGRDPRDDRGARHPRDDRGQSKQWDPRDRGPGGQRDDRGPRKPWEDRGRDPRDDRGARDQRDDRGQRKAWDPRGRGPGGQRDDRGPRRQWEDRGRDPRDDRGQHGARDDRGRPWDERGSGRDPRRQDERGPRSAGRDADRQGGKGFRGKGAGGKGGPGRKPGPGGPRRRDPRDERGARPPGDSPRGGGQGPGPDGAEEV